MNQGAKTSALMLDISKTPFSRYGAYLSIVDNGDGRSLGIQNVRRRFGEDDLFHLSFWKDGSPLHVSVSATPWMLTVRSDSSEAIVYMRNDTSLVVDSTGMDVIFDYCGKDAYGVKEGDGKFKIISPAASVFIAFDVLKGQGVLAGPLRDLGGTATVPTRNDFKIECGATGAVLVRMDVSVSEQSPERQLPKLVVEADLAEIRHEWDEFAATMPRVAEFRKSIAGTSWYNLWSCVVRAEDVYSFDAVLMSKKGMSSVWSWDHCFNALALACASGKMALEQFLLPFELQSKTGALPDMWNPGLEVKWGITKPPIHGWCFGKLLDACDNFSLPMLNKCYGHLEKLTNWWLTYRDADRNGIPEYPQGCDSGWDNSTLFDKGYFVESPDLAAYLVLQMHTLAKIAEKVGDRNGAARWRSDAMALLGRLIEKSWDGKNFTVRVVDSDEVIDRPTSLLALMPIVLGNLLDEAIMDKLVSRLEKEFLTPNGPATEALKSPLYLRDGYWRGPIWAPSTCLIVDGLMRAGRKPLALKIARGFCDMIHHKAGGNYENFDAVSGKGLRAPGYTWTASVNLMFLQLLHSNGADHKR